MSAAELPYATKLRVRATLRPDSKLTRDQIEAVACLYGKGFTLREIAARTWTRLGYSSPQVCAQCLGRALRRGGYATRSPAAAASLRGNGLIQNHVLSEAVDLYRSGVALSDIARRLHARTGHASAEALRMALARRFKRCGPLEIVR